MFAPAARRLRNTPRHICKLFECIIPVPVIYHFIQHVPASSIAFDLPQPPFRNFRPLKHIEYYKKAPNNIEIPPNIFSPLFCLFWVFCSLTKPEKGRAIPARTPLPAGPGAPRTLTPPPSSRPHKFPGSAHRSAPTARPLRAAPPRTARRGTRVGEAGG